VKRLGNEFAKILENQGVDLDDPEACAAHDAQVKAKFIDDVDREEEKRQRERRAVLLAGEAPEKIVRSIYAPEFKRDTGALRALVGLGTCGAEKNIRIIAGGVGSGKTWAAVRWIGDHGGSSPFFMRAHAFEAAGRYDRRLRERWQTCSALVLDDLGAEYADGKGNILADLDELFDIYATRMACLIVTTNLTPDQLRQRYGARIISRLRQHGEFRQIADPDMRRAL